MNDTPYDQVRQTSGAYQQACVLVAAAELDCCTVLLQNGNSLTAQQLAVKLQVKVRGITVLLDALTAMQYLVKSGPGEQALYSVAAAYTDILDSRHPNTFIPMLRHIACIQRSWVQLAQVIRQGEPALPQESILGAEEDRRSFILGMNSVAQALAEPTIHAMQQAGLLSFAKEKIKILDIGGASGTYTQAFLQALPQSEGAIFDLPVGISAAKQRFRGTALEQRVQFFTGDFYKDALPGGYDLAWISAIIHQMGQAESRALFAKTFQALLPGGRLLLRDFMMNAERTAPRDGAFFCVNMLVQTQSGRVYTFAEVKEELEAAGFSNVALAIPAASMSAIVVGEKRIQGSAD